MFILKEGEVDERLTPQQTAELLGVTQKTLNNWRSERTGPTFYKYGRIITYFKRDVLNFFEVHYQKVETMGADSIRKARADGRILPRFK